MNDEILSKEQRILRVMRKVLASIVKDATPQPGMLHPLSEGTIQDIRECFGLIASREAELAEVAGLNRNEKPFYTDQPQVSNVVKLHKPSTVKKSEDE